MSVKKKLTIFICILFTLFLSGCQTRSKNYEVKFIDEEEIEYSSDFKPADLLIGVNKYKKEDFKFNDDYSLLTLPDNSTVKINNSKKKIKLGTIKFDFLYKSKIYTKKILLKDTTAPEIVANDQYEVELNNSYFDLKNQISCKDNYTNSSSIELFFNGNYDLTRVGSYKVEVIAYDAKKNKSVREVTVNVVDRKVDNNYSQPDNNNSNNSTVENRTNSSDSKNSTNSSKTEKPKYDTGYTSYVPETKSFRIEKYGTFDACLNACQQYINTCLAKGYKGLGKAQPIQENGIYVGYQAVFS